MKIAFITTMAGVPWGGSESLWSETAFRAMAEGHTVFLAGFNWPEKPAAVKSLLSLGAQAYFRPLYTSSIKRRIVQRLKELPYNESAEIRAIKKFDPEVIVLSQGGAYDIITRPDLLPFFRATDIPYILICHNYNEELAYEQHTRQILLSLFNKAKKVLSICAVQQKTIKKQLLAPLLNMSIVSNPVNLKEPGIRSFPPAQPVMFAAVGGMHMDRKGQDIILESLSSDAWKERSWQLNFYGSGPDQEYLQELSRYYELGDKVIFHGQVSNIDEIWTSNHLLLMSSRIETGPMVLTEAMLCGRTVVATNVGQVPELIREGHNGFIAAAPNVALFAAALERAWEMKDDWKEMGRNAYHTAINRMDSNAAHTFLNMITGIN